IRFKFGQSNMGRQVVELDHVAVSGRLEVVDPGPFPVIVIELGRVNDDVTGAWYTGERVADIKGRDAISETDLQTHLRFRFVNYILQELSLSMWNVRVRFDYFPVSALDQTCFQDIRQHRVHTLILSTMRAQNQSLAEEQLDFLRGFPVDEWPTCRSLA